MVGAAPRLGDQRHVAGMERAHGRHEGDRAAVGAQGRDGLAAARSTSRMICTADGPPIEDERRARCGSRTARSSGRAAGTWLAQRRISSSSPTKRAAPASRPPRSTAPSRSPRRAARWRRSTSTPASARSAAISTIAPRRCARLGVDLPMPAYAHLRPGAGREPRGGDRPARRRRRHRGDRHARPRRSRMRARRWSAPTPWSRRSTTASSIST